MSDKQKEWLEHGTENTRPLLDSVDGKFSITKHVFLSNEDSDKTLVLFTRPIKDNREPLHFSEFQDNPLDNRSQKLDTE